MASYLTQLTHLFVNNLRQTTLNMLKDFSLYIHLLIVLYWIELTEKSYHISLWTSLCHWSLCVFSFSKQLLHIFDKFKTSKVYRIGAAYITTKQNRHHCDWYIFIFYNQLFAPQTTNLDHLWTGVDHRKILGLLNTFVCSSCDHHPILYFLYLLRQFVTI